MTRRLPNNQLAIEQNSLIKIPSKDLGCHIGSSSSYSLSSRSSLGSNWSRRPTPGQRPSKSGQLIDFNVPISWLDRLCWQKTCVPDMDRHFSLIGLVLIYGVSLWPMARTDSRSSIASVLAAMFGFTEGVEEE